MYFSKDITISANTAQADADDTPFKLTAGIIHRVEVQFPPGCHGLAHCSLWHDGHQYLPSNPDDDFAADGYIIPIDEYYELKPGNVTVVVKTWNADDTYDHTITVRIGVLSIDVLSPWSGITKGLRNFLRYVGVMK